MRNKIKRIASCSVIITLLIIQMTAMNVNANNEKDKIEKIKKAKYIVRMQKKKEIKIYKKVIIKSKNKIYKYSNEIILLAKLIQGEALGESYNCELAVANVILNRARIKNRTIKKIAYSRSQFSSINGRLFHQPLNEKCLKVAMDAIKGKNNIGSSTHFHSEEVKPYWTKHFKFIRKIGKIYFYESSEY